MVMHEAMLVVVCFCLSTGTRKDEWVDGSMQRSNFAWVDADGRDLPSTPEVIHSRRNGHLLRGRSAPSKCDRMNVEWGAKDQWFRYDDTNPLNFAWRWAQWERRHPCLPHERKWWPAFSPTGDAQPFKARQADSLLHVVLVQIFGVAAAAELSWHAFRVTIAMALLAARGSAVMRDEIEGVIQTLVRWKTLEALRIYARMKPGDYADYVDLATNTDAGLATGEEPPEIGPEMVIEEHDATMAAMAQAERDAAAEERGARRHARNGEASSTAEARPPAKPTPDPHRGRQGDVGAKKKATGNEPSTLMPSFDVGDDAPVVGLHEDKWAVTGEEVAVDNRFWGDEFDDGERTTCIVVGYIGEYVFHDGGRSAHTFVIEAEGVHYPIRHTYMLHRIVDTAVKRRLRKSGQPHARRPRQQAGELGPPPTPPASPPGSEDDEDMPPPDAPSPPSSPPWGDPNAVATIGAALQQLCHEIELVGTTEAAAWARRLQGARALEASSEHMALLRAIAALCAVMYERPPGTVTKIAVLAAMCMRLDDITGGTVRAAFGINRSTFDAARGRMLASGVMDALTLATAALDLFKDVTLTEADDSTNGK